MKQIGKINLFLISIQNYKMQLDILAKLKILRLKNMITLMKNTYHLNLQIYS